MDLASWRSQLRKGAAELAVLSVLSPQAHYGLEVLNAINTAGFELTEGTLSPLLNRLQRDGKIEAEWREVEGASHPRKYYRLSTDGAAMLEGMRPEWIRFKSALTALVEVPL
ncbi:MAG: PadR family transcriptional regulator [Planctomycetota bacterium]